MTGRPNEDATWFAIGLAIVLAMLIAGLSGGPPGVCR